MGDAEEVKEEGKPAEAGKAEKVKQNQVVRVTCKSSLKGTRCKVLKAEKDGSVRAEVLEGPQKGTETTIYAGDYEAA